jgi:lipoate-protein ligase A
LYQTVHGSLVDMLADWGLSAVLCGQSQTTDPRAEPFLCFQRRAPGDVLIDDVKVAGSAQRRRRGAVLQHGSLLLRRSAAAPELAGLGELASRPIVREELADAWLAVLASRLGVQWCRRPLSAEQFRVAASVACRYGSDNWTVRRR